MAPHRRGRDRRHPGSDRPNDTHGFDSRARDAGKDFRNRRPEQDRRGEQPDHEKRTRTKRLRPKSGPLGPVLSEIEPLPPLLDDEGTHRPPVRPFKVRVTENRPVSQGGNDRGKQEGKKQHRPSEPSERENDKTTDSPSSAAGRVRGARYGFEKAREKPKRPDDDHMSDSRMSSAKTERPRSKMKPLELEDALDDPYVRGLYEKQHGPVEQASRGHLRDVFAGLVRKTAEQTKQTGLERSPEVMREEKRKTERVENQKASDAIRKVMEYYVPGEGGARESFTKYQYNTMEQLGDLSETVSRLDTGRALKVKNRTEDLVKSLKEGEDPVTALRQFQMNRIVDRQAAMMDVGRLTGKALGRLTDTSLNHQDRYTGASSAVMEAFRRVEKDVLASSPLKTDQPTTTDFSHIPSRETFNLRLAENHAEARGAVQMANEAEQGMLKSLGVISSVGLGCGFVYERDEGSIHSIESWHGAFMVSRQNASAVSSQEFSRPAVASYVRREEGDGARMYLDKVAVLGDRAWQDLRSGKTYEDLYADTKGMSAQDVAGRLLLFAGGGADNWFSIYGRSGPLELNMKAVYQMTTGTEDMMVRDLNPFTVSPEELRKSGVMRTFTAEELGYGGKYLAQTRFQTGNFLTDFTTGSWTIASMLGRRPELVAERRLTGLRDSQGVEHDAGSVREELERLRFARELRAQRLGELFRNAQSVGFETVRSVTVRDPLAGLVIDRATESLAGPLTEVYKESRAVGEKLAKGKTVELDRAAFEALSSMQMSPRETGVAKAWEATSKATVDLDGTRFRVELRESKGKDAKRRYSIGNYAWGTIEQLRTEDSKGATMKRVFDGPLAVVEKSGNPEVFIYLPSAYTRMEGTRGHIYDCLEHIRRAPAGSVGEFPVETKSVYVEGQNRSDYRTAFRRLMRHEMNASGAVTEEARAEWVRQHIDPQRTIGIMGSLGIASKIATITQSRREAFTDFGASLGVDSSVIRASPENLSGRLHSAGVMAGEARVAAERAVVAESSQGNKVSQGETPPVIEVIEAKKQSSPRADGFTGQDGEFIVRRRGNHPDPESHVEVWTRSAATRTRNLVSEGTVLPADDRNTVRIGIGHSFPDLAQTSPALKKGRPLEDVLDTIKGFGVRVVFIPQDKTVPLKLPEDEDRDTTPSSSPSSP